MFGIRTSVGYFFPPFHNSFHNGISSVILVYDISNIIVEMFRRIDISNGPCRLMVIWGLYPRYPVV